MEFTFTGGGIGLYPINGDQLPYNAESIGNRYYQPHRENAKLHLNGVFLCEVYPSYRELANLAIVMDTAKEGQYYETNDVTAIKTLIELGFKTTPKMRRLAGESPRFFTLHDEARSYKGDDGGSNNGKYQYWTNFTPRTQGGYEVSYHTTRDLGLKRCCGVWGDCCRRL